MKRTIFFFFVFLSLNGSAQLNKDSLLKIWNNHSLQDTARLNAMGLISFDIYLNYLPDSAFYYAGLEYDLAKERKNRKFEAEALGTQGLSLYLKGDFVKAIDYATRSLKIREEAGDLKGQGSSLNNIGSIYIDQGEIEKGIEYFKKSLKIRLASGYKAGVAASYNNLGAVCAQVGKNEEAKEYYKKSLPISEELNDLPQIATTLNNIGRIYSYEANYPKAMECYNKSMKIREQVGDKRGMAMSYYNIGDIYSYLNDEKSAIFYNSKSLKLAQELGVVRDIQYAAEALSFSYDHLHQYDKALEMAELSDQMKDSLQNEESKNEVLKKDMQYNFDKQKALDEKEHEKQMLVSVERGKKQSVLSYSIAAGLILAGLFALFVFNRLRLTQNQKRIIEHQKHEVDEKQKEILDSITYAKRLQDAILPTESFIEEILPDNFVFYLPKDIVAGDFYWLEKKEELIFIAAADCTGHGVPGAMVSVVCANALNRSLLEFGLSEPGKILDKTRELVLKTFAKSDQNVKDGMDISLCCINPNTNEIKWAGANNALWYLDGNEIKEIRSDKQPIGSVDDPKPFTTHSLYLKKNDLLYLFTDGFADQFGGDKGKKFKYKPLLKMLEQNANLSMSEQKELLKNALKDWMGNLEQVDDVCIIGVRL